MDRAKDGALFALGLAVEKLQKLSGSDVRATATAAAFASVGRVRRNYSGVWDVSSKDSKFLGWLTSGDGSSNFNSIFSDYPSGAVRIFSSGGNEPVYAVPIEVINGGKVIGRCGFWVSDESQKVAINLVDRRREFTNAQWERVCHCCPQSFNLEAIFGKNNVSMCNSKIHFAEQLAAVDGDAYEIFLKNKHSLTLHSYGVLSDSTGTGLRRDLSQLAVDGLGEEEYLFPRVTDMPSHIPTLGFLLSFFRLSMANDGGKSPMIATEPMFNPRDLVPQTDPASEQIHGIYPVLVQANINIGLAVVGGNIALTFAPQIAVWNPYNTELRMADYCVELGVSCANLGDFPSLQLLGFEKVLQGMSQIGIFPLAQRFGQDYIARILRLNFSANFRPGEVKMFSVVNSQSLSPEGWNWLWNGDGVSGFLYVDTGKQAAKYDSIKIICTGIDGRVASGWDRFYLRLMDGQSGKILQEAAELTPTIDGPLAEEMRISTQNSNCFSLCSRMKYGIAGDASGKFGVRWLANCNPRAQSISRAAFQGYAHPFLQQSAASGNWNFSLSLADSMVPAKFDGEMLNYLGDLILFDVPDSTCGVLNVGHLRHVNFVPFGYSPSQILGSSRANPMIPLNETSHLIPQGALPPESSVNFLYDYSYLLNEVIFDKYFVSTKISGATVGDKLNFLVNRRFKLLNPREIFDGRNLAEILLIDGAFNVNSCSAMAWRCVLSAVKNSDGEVIFPRFYSARTLDQFPSFDGRTVEALAKKLADLIGERGSPFASIGEFANRTISTKLADCSRLGILQSAIDESNINADRGGMYVHFAKGIPDYDDASASGYLGENLPTVVNQGDVLQATAHFLCARGDTFLVRAFGDFLGANGDVAERVYCEAVVQRVPEYVDAAENTPSDPHGTQSTINEKFGRRYKIILFRWLDEDEI
ncbi:MAG: hypothetical protein LBB18_03750 [Puniceicoccales bacterium]|jgi:hypothetical protein|nr:hypothetical protein [Puniceicoccales bacterium]